MKFVRDGGDPEAEFQKAWAKTEEALDAQFNQMAKELIDRQGGVEGPAKALLDRVVNLNVVKPAKDDVDELQKRVNELQGIQKDMQTTLVAKEQELHEQRREVQALNDTVRTMGQSVEAVPPPSHESLVKLSEFGIKLIGGKK